SDRRITMRRDLPPRYHGSCCNLHTPAAPLHVITNNHRGPGCGQPPLHVDSMHVAAPPPQAAPTFAANRYPDEEDEGGQASSSLAVFTRWISAAKLLQSDLATLAQGREENRRWWLKL
ncbi:hypothetical protein BHE74_00059895, partial [Ensete ventricosum]